MSARPGELSMSLEELKAEVKETVAQQDKLISQQAKAPIDGVAAVHSENRGIPSMEALIPSQDEIRDARLTPTVFVKDYIYADVQTWAAPGGTGKTTITIHEAICLAVKMRIHGMNVEKPGWTLFITAEDRREHLIARIREMIKARGLSTELEQIVWQSLLIWDVTGEQRRLLALDSGNITLTSLADDIVQAYKGKPPVLVIFDPAISFGVSESFINDNENGIILACRRIVKGLDCCVRIIAHTGKGPAREGTLDQYSSRGGSALADGSRMVSVLQPWAPSNSLQPPPGCIDDDEVSIVILARPKLSYSPPKLPIIWVRRKGWTIESFIDVKIDPEEKDRLDQERVVQFLDSEVEAGKRHNKTTLETVVPGMSRARARTAITKLMVSGKIIEADLPDEEKKTRRKKYLITSAGFGGISNQEEVNDDSKTPSNNAAALREKNGGIICRPLFPTDSPDTAELRQDSAGLAGLPSAEDKTGGVLCREEIK